MVIPSTEITKEIGMIVVTGASGQLGRLVMEFLLQRVPAGQLVAAVRSPHKVADLADIVARSAHCLGLSMAGEGAYEIARRARGTPRIANRLLRRVRDFAEIRADGHISSEVASQALDMLDVDKEGFDYMDRKLLLAVIDKFMGGPVGLDNLAAAIGEEKDTIEDVLEPFLIQQGFLQRTPRGRIATQRAYQHFGLSSQAT